ncbi:hypothetical protein IWH25_10495 [Azospira restricta]|uniref:Uncharacterized protein n=2 Tax=Azospira restricta TaxID=404405 RepID=A0A974SSM6_9RHOO|nr:hypothetical protein IWH25_10495 [Azospira restricta]
MAAPEAGRTYRIELCSGELRRWRCLGADARGAVWWRDLENGQEFNEDSLMYAWRIVGPLAGDAGPEAGG